MYFEMRTERPGRTREGVKDAGKGPLTGRLLGPLAREEVSVAAPVLPRLDILSGQVRRVWFSGTGVRG